MSPRRYRYDPARRKAALEKTRGRIVRATVDLHAKHGAIGTSYAMIAKKADVSLPTVYHHFPTLGGLLSACSGHVLAQAPQLGPHIFEGLDDFESRLRALVRTLFALYRFASPWMRWSYYEARLVPEIAERYKKSAQGRRALIEASLTPRFGGSPPAALVGICEVLLDFPSWQTLTSDGRISDDEAEASLVSALLALTNTIKATVSAKGSSI